MPRTPGKSMGNSWEIYGNLDGFLGNLDFLGGNSSKWMEKSVLQCTCSTFSGSSLGLNLKDFLQIWKLVLDQPKMVTLKARTMPESMIWQILVAFLDVPYNYIKLYKLKRGKCANCEYQVQSVYVLDSWSKCPWFGHLCWHRCKSVYRYIYIYLSLSRPLQEYI